MKELERLRHTNTHTSRGDTMEPESGHESLFLMSFPGATFKIDLREMQCDDERASEERKEERVLVWKNPSEGATESNNNCEQYI